MSSSSDKKPFDLIERGRKSKDIPGKATFVGFRAADPFLQYQILKHNAGTSIIERLGGTTLPSGPAWITNTLFDRIGLSPYRSILWGMSVGSMLKQNFWVLAIAQEELGPAASASVGVFNTLFNSLNSLFFICSQTSASVNGEHFPQTPLIVGTSMYVAGLFLEWFSEVQRAAFKKNPDNKGKVYNGGLFGTSRHINYFAYTAWRTGYALAAGGWLWGATCAALFTYDFNSRAIPVLQEYLEEKYGDQYKQYEQAVPYKFVPFVW